MHLSKCVSRILDTLRAYTGAATAVTVEMKEALTGTAYISYHPYNSTGPSRSPHASANDTRAHSMRLDGHIIWSGSCDTSQLEAVNVVSTPHTFVLNSDHGGHI